MWFFFKFFGIWPQQRSSPTSLTSYSNKLLQLSMCQIQASVIVSRPLSCTVAHRSWFVTWNFITTPEKKKKKPARAEPNRSIIRPSERVYLPPPLCHCHERRESGEPVPLMGRRGRGTFETWRPRRDVSEPRAEASATSLSRGPFLAPSAASRRGAGRPPLLFRREESCWLGDSIPIPNPKHIPPPGQAFWRALGPAPNSLSPNTRFGADASCCCLVSSRRSLSTATLEAETGLG